MTWCVFSMGHCKLFKTRSFCCRHIIHGRLLLKKNQIRLNHSSVLHKGCSRDIVSYKRISRGQGSIFWRRVATWCWQHVTTRVEQQESCRTCAPPIPPTVFSEVNFSLPLYLYVLFSLCTPFYARIFLPSLCWWHPFVLWMAPFPSPSHWA